MLEIMEEVKGATVQEEMEMAAVWDEGKEGTVYMEKLRQSIWSSIRALQEMNY
jgi:hypothetical protein